MPWLAHSWGLLSLTLSSISESLILIPRRGLRSQALAGDLSCQFPRARGPTSLVMRLGYCLGVSCKLSWPLAVSVGGIGML